MLMQRMPLLTDTARLGIGPPAGAVASGDRKSERFWIFFRTNPLSVLALLCYVGAVARISCSKENYATAQLSPNDNGVGLWRNRLGWFD